MERESLLPPETRADDTPTPAHGNQARTSLDSIRTLSADENGQDNPAPASSQYPCRVQLRSSSYVLMLVSLYMVLALFSWAVTCILTVRPITTARYGVQFSPGGYFWDYYPSRSASTTHTLYMNNERWFQWAQVIQSIVAVFTIPLASTVCSKAAVVFVQRQDQRELSLRQTIALADRGWTDPAIYIKLLSGGLTQYGSKLLILAILLNAIGGIITPLRSVFLTTKTIKTPTEAFLVPNLADIPEKLRVRKIDPTGEIIVKVRSALTAASTTSPQGRLWTGKPINCLPSLTESQGGSLPMACNSPSMPFMNMSMLPDPFLAQLPSGYSTGLIRQYLPRINSTARRENITAPEFPTNCDALPGSLYFKYTSPIKSKMWSLEACMPANLTQSPWRPIRSRQDFTEELYLNISLPYPPVRSRREKGGLFKVSLDTTAGYFELPNYMNGEQPGPLLSNDLASFCRDDCREQGRGLPIEDTIIGDARVDLQNNRGPLSTIALALFGNGSFIADRVARPEAFMYPNSTRNERFNFDSSCVDQAPFLRLIPHRIEDVRELSIGISPCIKNNAHSDLDIHQDIMDFLYLLFWDPDGGERIKNAFTSAAFLVNEVWLIHDFGIRDWYVYHDRGADTVVPAIPLTGIIVVSVLLGKFLASLLGLAIYSALSPRWTEQLDAFAMLRIGASIADAIQFRPTPDDRQIRALDELPGWVGDATGGEGELGDLALGGSGKLDKGREFAAYIVETGSKEKNESR